MEKITNAPVTPIRLLPGDSSPLVVINRQLLEAEKKSTLEEGGGPVRKDQFPFKKISKKKKKSRNPQESLKVYSSC